MSLALYKKALKVLVNEGLDVFIYKTKFRYNVRNIYKNWIAGNEKDLDKVEELSYNPLFSVVIPVYNVADNMLRECIDSVLNQTYTNFEIILVDDASTMESVRTVLKEYESNDKVTVIYRSKNGHISRCTNDGINVAKGEFVALCDCDDLYAVNALYEVAKKLNENREYDFIYSDEDKISEDGSTRMDPFFKPDWSPETFMSYMYTCHLSVYRTSLLKEVGNLRVGFEGSQDYDLVLRIMEKTNKIGHVPKILYHWRMRSESTAASMTAKPYVMESTKKAKEEALERRKLKGSLTFIPDIAQFRVTYEPIGNPLVSVVIPSKDNTEVLKQCLLSVKNNTSYENYEVIVVDNGSSEENRNIVDALIKSLGNNFHYIYKSMEFNFSRMCNIGAAAAKGDYILFLNDDIEITDKVKMNPRLTADTSDWLSILTGQASVYYTGAVGCKLYYPNSVTFQHAGVVNYEIGPGHCMYGMDDIVNCYYGRNLLDYNFTIVTGACLMVNKNKFFEVGGFNEKLSIAYNDVALCFALQKAGYHNVLRNDIALVHHESVSRGLDAKSLEKEERRKNEMKILYDCFPEYAHGYDPCYNPNLVPDRGDFSYNMKNVHKEEEIIKMSGSGEIPSGYVKAKNEIDFNMDALLFPEDKIVVKGWAYNVNKRNNNRQIVKVVLVPKGIDNCFYAIKADKTYRSDVALKAGRRGCTLTGFDVTFEKTKLPHGEYSIGLLVDKYYVDLKKEINVL